MVSVYGVPIGIQGSFFVMYRGNIYYADETFTIEKNKESYNVDLHVDTSGGPQPPPVDPTNIQPKAGAGGPYYEQVSVEINFDGSGSYDPDGSISRYEWDFGDGTVKTGMIQTHIYYNVGIYTVILTVTDNKGKTDIDITYAYISEIPNKPPSKPVINGVISGTVNYQYEYNFLSTDKENDSIRYLIDWGDDTDSTASNFLDNGTIYSNNHSWIYPGIYTLRAYAIDEKEAISRQSEQVVLVDTIYCGIIGFMTDFTSDNVYDLFYSNRTGEETPVKLIGDVYLIDDNNDGNFDYQFNLTTFQVSNYVEVEDKEETSTVIDLIGPFIPYFFVFILLFLFITIGFLVYKIGRKSKKIKVAEDKDEKKKQVTKERYEENEKKDIESKKGSGKRIEDEIDELFAKKEK